MQAKLLLIPFLLYGSAVVAETYRWGASSVVYENGQVILSNELTTGGTLDFNVDMVDNGVEIRVVVMQGPGEIPDVLYVIPPSGYIAVPETISVEEGSQGIILIVPEGLS